MARNRLTHRAVRQRSRGFSELSVVFLLTFLVLITLPFATLAQQASQERETVGVPWAGERGNRETMADILARQQRTDLLARGKPKEIRLKKEKEIPERDQFPQDPNSPAVARWVPSQSIADNVQTSIVPLAPQSLGVNFTGATLADTGAFPPDSMGTVGPSQFVVFVNGRIRSFTKGTGAADGVLNADPDVFFASVMTPESPPGLNFTSDPQVRYDRLSGRWFLSIIDVPSSSSTSIGDTPNRWLLAVSDAASSNALSGGTVWTFYFVQQNTVGGGNTGEFLDYPSLGVDANALYVGGNMFVASSGAFSGCSAFVIRKSSVLNGGPVVVTAFRGIVPNSTSDGPYSPRGVDNYDLSSNEGYFIGSSATTLGRLVLRRVGTPGGTPSISANILLTVSTTSTPIPVQHLGNTGGNNGRLDALDDRLFAAHIRNGRLWTAHNIAVTAAGVASTSAAQRRDAVRWYELNGIRSTDNGGTPVVVQSGTIFDSAASLSSARQYWIPSVMVSGQGHAALGFSTAGTPFHADAATVGRLVGDTLGTTETVTNYTASTTAYNPSGDTGSTSGRRWGDYSFTSLDPNDDMTLWTIQEFCDSANSYGVRVTKLLAPPPATPVTCSPSSVTQGVSNVNIILTGTSASGSGFFDPGTGFPNHISTTINGGNVTVNSVTYSNPMTITLSITVATNASPTARTIAVTNPDGQAVTSATGILTIAVPAPPPLLSVQPPSLAYGLVAAGQSSNQPFQVINTGGQPLTGTATVSNAGSPFTIAGGSPFNIGGGQTGLVTVAFSPGSSGNFSNSIIFTSNGGVSTNPVTGTGVTPPQLLVTPSSRDFGTLVIGQTSNQTFSVINSGQATLSGTATLVAVTSPFAMISGSPYSVAGGQTSVVALSFSPVAAGNFSNTVVFGSNGGTSSNAVTGSAVTPPQLSVTPSGLNFGTIATGTTAQASFVVTNTGGTTLNGSATASGAPFAIVSGSPYGVAGFASTNVVVSFTPQTASNFNGTVTFSSNGGNATNTLNGIGATPPAASFTANPTDGVAPLSVTFTNTSAGTITDCFWDFGDGATSNTLVATVLHTYNATGTDTVTLVVSGPLGVNTNIQPNYITVTNIVPQADLALTKSSGPNPVLVGQSLTYTLTVTNSGLADAHSVIVTDALPNNVAFVTATPSQGSCTNINGTVVCNLNTLPNSSNAVVTILVTPQVAGTITNTAAVTSATSDPNFTNNTAAAVTVVTPLADLANAKAASPNPVLTSQSLTYTLTVTNIGPSTATGVIVTDAVPASVTVVSATPSQGNCTNIGGVVTCDLGSLASNGIATVTISGAPTAAGNITNVTNTATVNGNELDPFTTNNSASVTITVWLDSIGDGIPDWWRQQFFGSGATTNGNSCASCDPDGDGFSNLQEFLAGTDPNDPDSALRITSIVTNGPDVVISFTSGTNRLYDLQFNDDLTTSNWSAVVTNVPGTGTITSATDLGAITLTNRFYRVRQLP